MSSPMEKSSEIEKAAPPSATSRRYPGVLAVLRGYEIDPSEANLHNVVNSITRWLADKKPGWRSDAEAIAKYEARAPYLRKVLDKAQHLLSIGSGLASLAINERARLALQLRELGDGSANFLERLGEDWYSPAYRAPTSDLALNTEAIAIAADKDNLKIEQPLTSNLRTDTTISVGESRWDLEAINPGGDGRNVPDIANAGLGDRLKQTNMATARSEPRYRRDPEDFERLDASDLQALDSKAPVGAALARLEGHPVPEELHALNAYTQAGFYVMMNHVLNKRADRKFMATPEGQRWWGAVPRQAKQLISLAVSAARKMRPYTGGALYRGENLVGNVISQLNQPRAERLANWRRQIPTTKRYNQFVSTSKRAHSSYIVKKAKYTAEHITNSRSAVDVSALSGKLYEREVVFAPGTTFKVTNVEDRFDTTGTPDDRYGTRPDEAPPEENTEPGRIRVTLEEA